MTLQKFTHINFLKSRVFGLVFLYLIIFTASCRQEPSNELDRVKQEAVTEYKEKMEEQRQQKLNTLEKFYSVFETGDISVLPEVITEDYTQYPSDPGQTPDIPGFIKHAQDFGKMFSDLTGDETHILIDGDLAHVRRINEATHSGNVFGIEATGRRVTIISFDTHHFTKDGKIDKTWHLEDFWGAYSQIKTNE